MIDIEKVVNKWLRAETGQRVVAHPPEDRSTPWVEYQLIDAPQARRSKHDHVVEYLLQFDVYPTEEGGMPEAIALALEVRAALVAMPEGSHDAAVVTAVRINGSRRLPDTSQEPALDRYVVDAVVTAHG